MSGPLTGVRVVELGGAGPAPFAGMLLADLGADVVKIERPGVTGATDDWRFDLMRRGKRSAAFDLKIVADREQLAALIDCADVLIEGYRPGVAERLGVDPVECIARNPRLVVGRVTGWGQDGPLATTPGHDVTYLAATGILHAIGEADRCPQVPLNLVCDFAGGALYLVVGVLAALHHLAETGHGQVIDAAMVDGGAHLATMVFGMLAAGEWVDRRGANLLDGAAPYYSVYPTADGRHLGVGAIEPTFFASFLGVLGVEVPEAQDDRRSWPAVRERIARRVAERTAAEWRHAFAGSEACVSVVESLSTALDHAHLQARGTFVAVDGVRQPAPAPRLGGTPGAIRHGPRRPGSDTRAVVDDWLGAEAPASGRERATDG